MRQRHYPHTRCPPPSHRHPPLGAVEHQEAGLDATKLGLAIFGMSVALILLPLTLVEVRPCHLSLTLLALTSLSFVSSLYDRHVPHRPQTLPPKQDCRPHCSAIDKTASESTLRISFASGRDPERCVFVVSSCAYSLRLIDSPVALVSASLSSPRRHQSPWKPNHYTALYRWTSQ
jgi:hypothetical protein